MTFKLSLQRGFGRWWEHLGGEETCQFDKTKVKLWSVLYHMFTIRTNNCKKYQKIDIIVALYDAMTTILTTNLDNDLDNQFWQPILTANPNQTKKFFFQIWKTGLAPYEVYHRKGWVRNEFLLILIRWKKQSFTI